VVGEVPENASSKYADLGAHPSPGQLSKHLRVTLAGDQRTRHLPTGEPEDVRGHRFSRDPSGCTANFRTSYTPTEAPMLRKKTTIDSMKLPTHAPVSTGFGMMKTRIKIMINSVDSHLGIQTG
jgi:hypothetical protein